MTKRIVDFSSKDIAATVKSGDFAAYEVLFKTYYQKLCNYVYKLGHDRNLAEDIAQETFTILWEKRENINAELSIQGYLFKICHNEFLKHTRTKKRERAYLDQVKAEVYYDIKEVEALHDENLHKLRSSIKELSPRCREALVLSRLEKLKYTEIADQMGISKKTVEGHISKAFLQLRKQMGSLGFFILILLIICFSF